jgi:hypothetical protein
MYSSSRRLPRSWRCRRTFGRPRWPSRFAAQDQIAVFFVTDGVEVIDPDGPGPLFETPVVLPLSEDVVFFP